MQRLTTRAQFQAALAGSIVARSPHFALHRLVLDAASTKAGESSGSEPSQAQTLFGVRDAWLGAIIPKRWARRAVTRNAIRRQIYQVSAQQLQPDQPPAAHVVRLRSGFDRLTFLSATSTELKQSVRSELQQLFNRAKP